MSEQERDKQLEEFTENFVDDEVLSLIRILKARPAELDKHDGMTPDSFYTAEQGEAETALVRLMVNYVRQYLAVQEHSDTMTQSSEEELLLVLNRKISRIK